MTINDFLDQAIKHGLGMVEEGNSFVPFMNTISEDGPMVNVLDGGGTVENSLVLASRRLGELDPKPKYYAVVYEGAVTIEDKKHDCLMIEVGAQDKAEADVVVQPYKYGSPAETEGEFLFSHKVVNRIAATTKVGPFSSLEWNKIQELPVALFFLVAGADGDIDQKEQQEFVKILNSENLEYAEGVRAMILSSGNDYYTIRDEVKSDGYDKWNTVEVASKLFEKCLTEEESLEYKKSLYQYSVRIASSSGGFLGFGSKIDKQELAVLNKLKSVFEL